MVVIFGV